MRPEYSTRRGSKSALNTKPHLRHSVSRNEPTGQSSAADGSSHRMALFVGIDERWSSCVVSACAHTGQTGAFTGTRSTVPGRLFMRYGPFGEEGIAQTGSATRGSQQVSCKPGWSHQG